MSRLVRGRVDVAIPGPSRRQDGAQGRRGVFAAERLCLLVRKIPQNLPLLPEPPSCLSPPLPTDFLRPSLLPLPSSLLLTPLPASGPNASLNPFSFLSLPSPPGNAQSPFLAGDARWEGEPQPPGPELGI